MSGRSISGWREDGTPIRGFRKTKARRLNRRRPHEMPDWRLTFTLPPALCLIAPGPVAGLVGVHIHNESLVEIVGKDRAWVFGRAAALLRQLAQGEVTVRARLERDGTAVRELDIRADIDGSTWPREREPTSFRFIAP